MSENKKKKTPKAYIDSDIIESEGSRSTTENSGDRRRRAIKNLKNKTTNQLFKTLHERMVDAEKYGQKDDLEKAKKKLEIRKKILKD